jgi:histidinol phosphatase-like PHP family hydrolase
LLPIELIRRAVVAGYRGIGVTDHCSMSNVDWVAPALQRDCALANAHWDIVAIPGVEITHVPAAAIADVARAARQAGAKLVVVHGETPVEPVEPGTDLAAANCADVDIIAHPGRITMEAAEAAARQGIFLEITVRRGHSLTNGWVVEAARRSGARLLLNTDTHACSDLLTPELALNAARGAGLSEEEMRVMREENPQRLLERIQGR